MTRLLSTDEVAAMLNASPAFVRSNQVELGAIRLGGARSPLRFEEHRVRAFLDQRRVEPAKQRRRPGPKRSGGVRLLPLPAGAR